MTNDSLNPDFEKALGVMIEILVDIRESIATINENLQSFEQVFIKSTNEYTYPNFG